MSTHSSPQRPDFPSAAVDRVFARMLTIYGTQKMATAWDGVDADERRAVWAAAIAKATWVPGRAAYDLGAIGEALEAMATDGSAWPPTLPEFIDRVERRMQRPGRNVLALPVPRRTDAELAAGREQMSRIRGLLRRAIKPMPQGAEE